MDTNHLWEKLPLPDNRLATFKKDISEGKVPELPFYIIGQLDLKKTVKERIEQIDSARMITNLIIAEYGNGKTNLLKYLELFYKTYPELGVSVQYSRADVERTDLVLFLLKIVQDKYLPDLINIVKLLRQTTDAIPGMVNNYESNFREIKDYTQELFKQEHSDEVITELLYLGTGRLYNKRYFDKFNLEQLKDFNRREILVLFLNLLSNHSKYIIFAIDEIEKIREKSKIRFNHFLTSYRELVDLFNQIKGHYLLVSFTDSVGSSEISKANDALYTRIKNDIVNIEALKAKDDIIELIEYLNELFETKKVVSDIYSSFIKKGATNNRVAIQEISKLLYEQELYESFETQLEKAKLTSLFEQTKAKLENDEAFKNLHRKFFDPFEYYIDSLALDSGALNKQERTFVDVRSEKVHYFIFNTYLEDFDNERIRVSNLITENPDFDIVVYAPVKLELTHSRLNLNSYDKLEIVDFDPRILFILFVMYKENYDYQLSLSDIITKYTRNKL
ncbi:hypothetical protein [Algoriphagus yeomjeoni]|uniref:Uncharacterized protein n=1 Tax=Algoriphagus yeomjeoni TaxID=291403 RepID=A0A327P9B8_9BACT|nr:hypothetical protein [Algoriphagus yeomjeoni]RAI88067.1 hypothetical protein LV83_02985 [Algoriphagus yeomjeoni]